MGPFRGCVSYYSAVPCQRFRKKLSDVFSIPREGVRRCGIFRRFRSSKIRCDRVVNFLPVNRNIPWGLDSEPNFVATDLNHDDSNLVVDDDAFVFLPGRCGA